MFSSFLDTSRELGGDVECLVMKPGSRLTSVLESNPCIQKGLLQIRLRICLKHLWPSPTRLQRGKLREKKSMWQDGLEGVTSHSRCNEDILYICTHTQTHIYTHIYYVCVSVMLWVCSKQTHLTGNYYLLKILKHKSRNCLPVFLFYFLFRFSLFHTHTRLNIFIY